MTTHTDRKSGFGGFPSKGVQPLPTEPAQVHEDPGAAYWKEATKMAEHTDRIRQMAQEAGASFDPTFESVGDNPAFIMSPEQLTRFAQLVAEDCARVAEERHAEGRLMALAREGWDESALAAYAACADGMGVDIRARYSLKD